MAKKYRVYAEIWEYVGGGEFHEGCYEGIRGAEYDVSVLGDFDSIEEAEKFIEEISRPVDIEK